MNRKAMRIGVGIVLLLLVTILAGCTDQQQVAQLQAEKAALEQQNKQLKELAGPLPASLDNYFPPKAQGPVWLFEMFNLAGPLESIGVDLQEDDMAGVKADFAAFKAQYAKMAEMAPEWKSRFPMASVEALGKAVDSGDPGQIGSLTTRSV